MRASENSLLSSNSHVSSIHKTFCGFLAQVHSLPVPLLLPLLLLLVEDEDEEAEPVFQPESDSLLLLLSLEG
jgi:hypothetical protein